MKYRIALYLLVLIAACTYYSSELVAFWHEQKPKALIAYQLDPFPEKPAQLAFYNDSGIRGADDYARYELKRAHKETGYEFAIVLRPTLPRGYSLESYASELFDAWKIGANTGGKGLLFLFIEDDQELKIEVGYELEDMYPDTFCLGFQETIKSYMSGNYYGDVFGAMIAAVVDKHNGQETFTRFSIGELKRGGMSQGFLSGGAGVSTKDFYNSIQQRVARSMEYNPTDIDSRFPAGLTPDVTAVNFLSALENGIDYPFLPCITKGSQMMRLEYPHPPAQLKTMWQRYAAAGPMYIMQQGDLAVARFSKGNAFHLLMRRNKDKQWLVDFPKTWAYQASPPNKSFCRLENPDNQWMFAFRDSNWRVADYRVPTPADVDADPYEHIHHLQQLIKANPNDADLYFQLGEFLYYECYWIRAAIRTMEKGLALEPDTLDKRFMCIDMRLRFPMWDGVTDHYEAMVKHYPNYERAWNSYAWFTSSCLNDKKLNASVRSRSPFHN